MQVLFSLLIGYVLGSLSPAALLSIALGRNLHEEGTGNLGATNTMLVLGKNWGVCVMVFDVCKSWLAARIAKALFPQLVIAALLGSLGAVIGHIFSMFLRFHGGKGVAAFGGMILAYDPGLFLPLLAIAVLLMTLCNYGVAGPVSAGILFPILVYADSGSPAAFLTAALAGILMILAHRVNFARIRSRHEQPFRPYVAEKLHLGKPSVR